MRANRFNHCVSEGCLPQSNSATLWLDASSSTADRGGFVCGSLKYRLLREESLQGGDDLRWTVECLSKTRELCRRKLKVLLISQSHFSRATRTLNDESSHLLASLLRTKADQAFLAIGGAKVDPLAPCCRFLFEYGCHDLLHLYVQRAYNNKDATLSANGCQIPEICLLRPKGRKAALSQLPRESTY